VRSNMTCHCKLAEATTTAHMPTNDRVRPAASEGGRSKHNGGLQRQGWPSGRGCRWLRQHASRPNKGAWSSPRVAHGSGRGDWVEGRGRTSAGDEAAAPAIHPAHFAASELLEEAGSSSRGLAAQGRDGQQHRTEQGRPLRLRRRQRLKTLVVGAELEGRRRR
jgi:hypothetical protein